VKTATTLGAFALGLTVVFAGAVGVGNAVGPVGTAGTPEHATAGSSTGTAGLGTGSAWVATPSGQPQGLSASLDGYTLRLDTPSLPLGGPSELALRIVGPDGRPVTAYTPTHDKDLHLILVRRDGNGFQHLHPTRDAAGRWAVPVSVPQAGAYKVFADTAPAGRTGALTLAADLQVAGDYRPAPPPPVSRTAQVDGYTVTLTGDLVAGQSSPLVLSVSRGGRPVTDLQPYLAAYGHLVSLREGDLAYLHTHPDGAPGDGRTPAGPDVAFGVDVPTPGAYRLYLDFQHQDVVRTAEFTAIANGAGAPAAPDSPTPAPAHDDTGGHGH
jgi:hypothetical protein